MTPLDADAIEREAGTKVIGREIIVVEETTSTNDLLLASITRETTEGLVIFAESQTAERGRHGSRWISTARRGLWFSIFLLPRVALADSARLTNWLAAQIAATVRIELGLAAMVKRPNDVYIDDHKIAGVLVEMRATPGSPHIAIAGIGINVNQRAEDFPEELRAHAGSLGMYARRELDRQGFAIALLRDLDRSYAELFG